MSNDGPLEIATDAYVYFYPIVQNLKTLFQSSIWPHTLSYTPLNQFKHATRLVDWKFTGVVKPNNDTLYSSAFVDLDQEPVVLKLPSVPDMANGKKRYYSMQIVDGYTYNMRIISPRTTGSWDADAYIITGPSFKGTVPSNFDKDHIIESTSRFTLVLGRTAVYGQDDIPNVLEIQKGYTLSQLHEFKGEDTKVTSEAALPIFPFIDFDELAKDSPEPQLFFTYANFIMNYIRVYSDETELMQRFAKISVGPLMTFNGQGMSKTTYLAIKAGITAGGGKIDLAPLIDHFGNSKNGWKAAINPPLFGNRDTLKGKFATRAFAAKYGLYGADPQEAYYPSTAEDIDGDAFDSTKNNYTLTFSVGSFPSIKDGGFWSVTMYHENFLVHNPIDRYSIGDRTEGLVYEDGSLTLYIQKDQPDTEAKAANWLPAPDPDFGSYKSGLFSLTMRVYWPTEEDLSIPYMPPGVIKAGATLNAQL